MRTSNRAIRILLIGLALMVLLAGAVSPIAAQEGDAPSVTLSGATIQVDAGETTEVTATYKFAVGSVGSGEKKLSSISGTAWTFPDHQLGDFSATVNGEEVSPDVTKEDRYVSLSVPVSDVSAGDTVTVQLTYTVTSAAGELKAPLWVPEFQTTGTDRVIDMSVTLPENTQVHGAAFPKIDNTEGNTLHSNLLHLPGFVSMQYGPGAGSLFSLDVLSTLVGLIIIFSFFGIWGAWQRGLIGDGGESNVA